MLFAMCMSCKDGSDLLDPAVGGITEEDVFTDAQNSMLFLNDIIGMKFITKFIRKSRTDMCSTLPK